MRNFVKTYDEHTNESKEFDYLSKNKQMLSKKVGRYFTEIKSKYKNLYATTSTKYDQRLGLSISSGIDKILKKIHEGEIENIKDLNNHMVILLRNNKIDITLSDY